MAALTAFVETNLDQLSLPWTAEPVDAGWRDEIDSNDPHQMGDLALTAFYDPGDDLGLGPEWLSSMKEEPDYEMLDDHAQVLVLGQPFGPSSNLFDPGKMGRTSGPLRRSMRSERH
jgi:hypothetical protein